MKVLQINTVCGIGSTGRIATDIDKMLKDNGHESYIAYGRDIPMNCNTAIRIGSKLDNYTHVAKTRLFDKHGFGSTKATHAFIRQIEELNPDVIHLHNIHGYYINIEILFEYLKLTNKSVIWTLHDCWAFTGHCSYFDNINCDRWISGCFNCPQKNSYPSSVFMDNSKNNFTLKKEIFTNIKNLTIVTPSKWLAEVVSKSFLRNYSLKVINNGIDLETFKPIECDLREKYNIYDKFIILGIANRWIRSKGYDYFIELSERVEKDEVIIMVGLTEKQIKKLPSNIIGITRTNNTSELAEIYSSADVFINPTLADNFPTTNLEAIACGTPVITFDTGGSVECIDKSCGYTVEKGQLNEIIDKIQKIKDQGKLKYSQSCIQRAKSLYDKKKFCFNYMELYKHKLTNQESQKRT